MNYRQEWKMESLFRVKISPTITWKTGRTGDLTPVLIDNEIAVEPSILLGLVPSVYDSYTFVSFSDPGTKKNTSSNTSTVGSASDGWDVLKLHTLLIFSQR